MLDHWKDNLSPMRAGLFFSLLTILYGFGLGAAFGAAEDSIKDHLADEATKVMTERYADEGPVAKKVVDKSWTYLKRAHLHANGLGTSSLALIVLLSFLAVGASAKKLVALALGVGGLGYAMYWMFAGLRAPGMGSTSAAKESLEWLAIPSSGLCILGLVAVIFLLVRQVLRSQLSASD